MKVVRASPLPPGISWYSFLEAESTPGHMELSDAPEKNPQWPGIDPGTLRLVAQCLNHYATPGAGQIYTPGNGGSVNVGWEMDGCMKVDIGLCLENLSRKLGFIKIWQKSQVFNVNTYARIWQYLAHCLMEREMIPTNINTLRTGSFKLFKRPFPGFLTILTL